MKCSQVDKLLNDYLDGNLSPVQKMDFNMHIRQCKTCRYNIEQYKTLLQQLRDIPAPSPRYGFEKRVFSFLGSTTSNSKRSFRISHLLVTGLGTAITAGLAMWLVLTPATIIPNKSVEKITIQLVPEQTKNINLVFHSPHDFPGATLKLELTDGIELARYPGKKLLQWNTTIKKGANRLNLPLVSRDYRGGKLLAHIIRDGKTRTFSIDVITSRPASQLNTLETLSMNSFQEKQNV